MTIVTMKEGMFWSLPVWIPYRVSAPALLCFHVSLAGGLEALRLGGDGVAQLDQRVREVLHEGLHR